MEEKGVKLNNTNKDGKDENKKKGCCQCCDNTL